jgi:hypothetical protein
MPQFICHTSVTLYMSYQCHNLYVIPMSISCGIGLTNTLLYVHGRYIMKIVWQIKRVWRYQGSNKNPYIEEEQTTQWPKEKDVVKDMQYDIRQRKDNLFVAHMSLIICHTYVTNHMSYQCHNLYVIPDIKIMTLVWHINCDTDMTYKVWHWYDI